MTWLIIGEDFSRNHKRYQRDAHQALVPTLAQEIEDMTAREVEDKPSLGPDMRNDRCRRVAPHTSFGSAAKMTELHRWVHSPKLHLLKAPDLAP
jgi:hypothetical protein